MADPADIASVKLQLPDNATTFGIDDAMVEYSFGFGP
jgi:hypothetical protein